jgi:hypothetical protein
MAVKISVLGSKSDYEWLYGSTLDDNLQFCEPNEINGIMASEYCSGSIIIVGAKAGFRFPELANLIRHGHSLFIYDILILTEDELTRLIELAEEAGVVVFPRLPGRLMFSSEDRLKPLAATLEVGLPADNKPVSWITHCINSVAFAVSLVPFGVKRTKYVDGDGIAQHTRFFGCQLEFENSSLVSVSVSLNGKAEEQLIRVVGHGGIYRYSKELEKTDDHSLLHPISAKDQLLLFLNALQQGETMLLAQELRQAMQILHIYHDLESRFVQA